MEVNALFVSGNTIKSAARALPTFSASYVLLRTTRQAHRRDSAAFPAVIDTIPLPHPAES